MVDTAVESTEIKRDLPTPGATLQVTEVSEDHVASVQRVRPTRTVGPAPGCAVPNPVPENVIVTAPVVGALKGEMISTTACTKRIKREQNLMEVI
jgi:hypothetical protein